MESIFYTVVQHPNFLRQVKGILTEEELEAFIDWIAVNPGSASFSVESGKKFLYAANGLRGKCSSFDMRKYAIMM